MADNDHVWVVVGPNAGELWNRCVNCRADEHSVRGKLPCSNPPTANMARIQGEGGRLGRTSKDIPDGFISWDEHHEAWAVYSQRWSGQSSEDVESRGGFGYHEITKLLGRPPRTWVPRDAVRFKDFVFDEEDRPGHEEEVVEEVLEKSHIYYLGGSVSICEQLMPAAEAPIYFEDSTLPGCKKCFTRMVDWLDWFTGERMNE